MKDNANKKSIILTASQNEIVDGITNFINSPFTPTRSVVGLSGASGTGKSTCIKNIIYKCKYSDSVVAFCAPTHKACRVLESITGKHNVSTIQSRFGFRLDLKLDDFDPSNPIFNPIENPKLNDVLLLVVDEASMLNLKLVNYIINECKQRKIKLLFVGDPYQLSAVNERKSYAFDLCHKVYELDEIIRQNNENPVNNLLAMLREDVKKRTFEFIKFVTSNIGKMEYNGTGDGYSIMGMEDFKKQILNKFSLKSYTTDIDESKIIAYTNRRVNSWNNFVRKFLLNNPEKILVLDDLIMSYNTVVDQFNSLIISNSEEYIIDNLYDYVDEKYGFKGFLAQFKLIHGGTTTKPLFVIDHKDEYTVNKFLKVLLGFLDEAKRARKGNKVRLWRNYYDFKNKYFTLKDVKQQNSSYITRDIDYGFSITAHRSQGSTYGSVFVDLNDMIYDANGRMYGDIDNLLRRLYVACTRERNELFICFGK